MFEMIQNKCPFFNGKKRMTSSMTLNESAAKVLRLCQEGGAQVEDEQLQAKLNHLAAITKKILYGLSFSNRGGDLGAQVLELQLGALELPKAIHEKSKLASWSYLVAMISLFILAFSVSLSTGYLFYGLVYSSFDLVSLKFILATGLAVIGVPASGVGIFSYYLSIFLTSSKQEVIIDDDMFESLKNEINDFCHLAEKEQNANFVSESPLNRVDDEVSASVVASL